MEQAQTRIYFPGVFDLINHRHFGIFQYYKGKKRNASLIVGVFADQDALQVAGNVVLSATEREESVKACKWVDKVLCPCPRFFTVDFLIAHRIDYVCVSGTLVRPQEAVNMDLDYKSQYSELRATLAMAGRFIAKKAALQAKYRRKFGRDAEAQRSLRIESQAGKLAALEDSLQRSIPVEEDGPPAPSLGPLLALRRASDQLSRDVMASFNATVAWASSLLS